MVSFSSPHSLLVLLPLISSAFVPSQHHRPISRAPPTTTTTYPTTLSSSPTSDAADASDGTSSPRAPPRVCVLGGGFGGVNAALTLAGLPWPDDCGPRPEITVVDRDDRFVFLPLLYELCVDAASMEEVAPTYASLLGGAEGVRFVRREVTGVDAANGVVHVSKVPSSTEAGERGTVPYDALVVATGAQLDLGTVPGAEEHALPFYTVEQCVELRRRVSVLDQKRAQGAKGMDKVEVVIIGGGYGGVELALNLLERLGGRETCGVTLIHRGSQVLQYATEYNRKIGTDRLGAAGVEVRTDTSVVEINAIDDDEKSTGGGSWPRCTIKLATKEGEESSISADLLLWTAGATPTNDGKGVLNSVLPRDGNGRIITGDLLRVKNSENAFSLGDCSRARKVPYAATAQVAMQQAPVVAWNVHATLINKIRGEKESALKDTVKLLPFNYLDLGEMMTLGNDDATITGLGGLFELSGAGASILRRLVYAARMPTPRQGVTAALESTSRRLRTSSRAQGNRKKSPKKVIQWK